MTAKVEPQQFRITATGITHIPTGAKCRVSRRWPDASVQLGTLACPASGEDGYRAGEVLEMMDRLWADHITRRKSRKRARIANRIANDVSRGEPGFA